MAAQACTINGHLGTGAKRAVGVSSKESENVSKKFSSLFIFSVTYVEREGFSATKILVVSLR